MFAHVLYGLKRWQSGQSVTCTKKSFSQRCN